MCKILQKGGNMKIGLGDSEKLALIEFLIHSNGWDTKSKIERIHEVCEVEDSDD